MTRIRRVVLLLGLLVGAYGVLRLLELGWSNTRATLEWLVAGVVLHDAVFAPIVIVAAVVALRILPHRLLAPGAAALIVLVPVTLLSVPELGRFGARPDNPTLLDRDYWLGWSGLATLVLVVALTATVLRSRRRAIRGGDHGPGDGGR